MARAVSPKKWLPVYWVSFATCLVAAAAIVGLTQWERSPAVTRTVLYAVLVPLGLGAAGFLFGALRSYAEYEGSSWFGTIKLGGPAVVFALVVAGGVYVGTPESTFDLLVRVEGPTDLLNGRRLRLYLGQAAFEQPLDDNGQARFVRIARDLRDSEFEAVIEFDGYRLIDPGPRAVPEDGVIRLAVEPIAVSTVVRIKVVDEQGGPVEGVRIDADSGLAVAATDRDGNAEMTLPLAPGDAVRLTAWKDGRQGYDHDQTLPGPWTIRFSPQH